MKTILLPLLAAVTTAVAAPEFERQQGKDKSKPMDSYEDSKETRKTSAGTYWTEDTRPMPIPVPESKSPLVILTIAGVALLSRRARK